MEGTQTKGEFMANNMTISVSSSDNSSTGLLPVPLDPVYPRTPNLGGQSVYLRKLSTFFQKLGLGVYNSQTIITTGQTRASGTVTLSSFAAADTVTINGTVLTGSATPSGAAQFLTTGGDTVVATALALCINNNATLDGQVFATSAGAVVTVTCVVAGLLGNLCTLAISAHGTVSGAVMTGGAEGSSGIISHGLNS